MCCSEQNNSIPEAEVTDDDDDDDTEWYDDVLEDSHLFTLSHVSSEMIGYVISPRLQPDNSHGDSQEDHHRESWRESKTYSQVPA